MISSIYISLERNVKDDKGTRQIFSMVWEIIIWRKWNDTKSQLVQKTMKWLGKLSLAAVIAFTDTSPRNSTMYIANTTLSIYREPITQNQPMIIQPYQDWDQPGNVEMQ